MLSRAITAHQAGNIPQAEFLYKLVLQADKKQFDALHMLAIIEGQRGNFVAALSRIKEALRIRPKSVEALINLGRIEAEIDHYANAVMAYERALALDPSAALAHSNLGIVLRRQGRLDAALGHCDAALRIAPDFAEAWNNRGNVLFDLEQFHDALESYDRAVRLQPKLAEAHLGRGNIFIQLRRFGEALAAYESALAVRPDSASGHLGRGNALRQMMRVEEALAAYDRALAVKHDYAECQLVRGEMLLLLGRHDAARDAFAKGFALNPDQPYAEGALLAAKLQSCDWSDLDTERAHLIAAVGQGLPRVDPLRMLYVLDSPADQLKCAGIWVADRYPPSPQPLWRGERYGHERIRVAYLSADFRHHAVAYLTAGMFEAHDRSRFETTAVSTGPETNDDVRARLRGAFDRFLDVRSQSDQEVAELLRRLEIDIVVDLSGFTENSRPHIMAQRPAPVQASYLGYSATMGASYIDYIIADKTIIPPEHAAFFTENIAWLPDTYMVNDAGRRISERTPSRAECGLPDDVFVFCCFNHPYKICPDVFRIWMRLLKDKPDSVLWLSGAQATAQANLRREAEKCGVASQRLIFAPRTPEMADHLARQRQADLFLDTLPYNAHTTSADALWAGVPVVTCLGSAFAGRVAASLLRAVGLHDLVTESLEDYEALARRIAADPALCAALKGKLAGNRNVFPLFDTDRFTRNIEAAFSAMWERRQRGESPQSFTVGRPDLNDHRE
jgi:predicted O-linked N-acetylglucosamine transferase (SPINDLY family)